MADKEQWHWQDKGTAWKGVGIYHVTMTIPSRQPLLGELIIPNNDPKQAKVELTELGNQIKDCVQSVIIRRPEIQIIKFRMMPDHLHVILYVTRTMPVSIREVVRGLWQGAKKYGRQYSATQAMSASKQAMSISPHTMRDNEHGEMLDNEHGSDPIFTEMPFIRVMSRRGQLQTMVRYVLLNHERLATKRLKPGFFRVQSDIEIGGRTYSGVGNAVLLQAERFMPVHVRRWMVEAAEHGDNQALRDYMNGCIVEARHGAVMVSPFISPQEKQVMNMLLKEQHPFIYLADNGFRDYYKPQDSLFDACAAGRVLILSPWEYDEGKKHISRADCVALNKMAEDIAGQDN